jgi:serine/threonine protein kinase
LRLGRYEVLRHLADGGMAELLLARSTGIEGFERHVVIKRIHGEQARNKQHVDMFLDEARLAASLHHNNIVQVHDVGQENGEYFFAMEYVHGEDLRKILTHLASKRLQLPLEHVITIISAAAAGLHYAHEMKGPNGPLGIVHRDVSPANILVGYDGNVKVIDFGIAKAIARASDTQAGTLKGKAAYMAPEQCTGVPIDRRSDVFALGIVLWELLTVRRLFKGASDFVTMTAIVSGKLAKPSEYRKDLPKPLEAIVLKALATSAQDRYQSCEEVRLALEDFAVKAGLRTSTTAVGDYMVKQFGRRTEPWLVENDDPVIEILDPDFDGSPDEVVDIASAAIPQSVFDIQSSPIMKARARARTTGQPVFPTPVAGTPQVQLERKPSGNDSSGFANPDAAPETGSGTPMAWTPSERLRAVSPPGSSRKRWLIGAAIAAPLVIVGVLILSRGHGAANTSADVSAPASTPVATPPPAPPPPPAAEPPPPPPTPVVAPEPPKAEVAKPVKKHAQGKPKPAPAWDRNALFPK